MSVGVLCGSRPSFHVRPEWIDYDGYQESRVLMVWTRIPRYMGRVRKWGDCIIREKEVQYCIGRKERKRG